MENKSMKWVTMVWSLGTLLETGLALWLQDPLGIYVSWGSCLFELLLAVCWFRRARAADRTVGSGAGCDLGTTLMRTLRRRATNTWRWFVFAFTTLCICVFGLLVHWSAQRAL